MTTQDAECLSEVLQDLDPRLLAALSRILAENERLREALEMVRDHEPSENETAAADYRRLKRLARQALSPTEEP